MFDYQKMSLNLNAMGLESLFGVRKKKKEKQPCWLACLQYAANYCKKKEKKEKSFVLL